MPQPIEDHGLIGDLRTIALVGFDATIDFCCWPRFESTTIFASLLDDDRGGRFELAPMLAEARRRQFYLDDTNILLTRFMSEDGVAEISDLMSLGDDRGRQCLVRRAKAVRGNLRFHVRFAPAFDYGRASHRLQADGQGVICTSQGTDQTSLGLHPTFRLRSAKASLKRSSSWLQARRRFLFLRTRRTRNRSLC